MRVAVTNVDRMLPWFDEYQVDVLRDECETLLMTLPVTGARLLQSYSFNLKRQFRRCAEELSDQQFLDAFVELASVPDVLRGLIPILKAKYDRLRVICSIIEPKLDSGVPFDVFIPVLEVCCRNCAVVNDDMANDIIQLQISTQAEAQMAATLLAGECRRREAMVENIFRLANDVY